MRRCCSSAPTASSGLASRDKLGTVAPFTIGPADALTHLAIEPGVPAELLAPFVELGIEVVVRVGRESSAWRWWCCLRLQHHRGEADPEAPRPCAVVLRGVGYPGLS